MDKKIYILILFITISGFLRSQTEIPKSYVNIGLGGGVNYGIFGTKTVIGYKNSGLLIGLGYVPDGGVGYQIGGQFSAKWFFANVGYGVTGTQQINSRTIETIYSGFIVLGGMINIGRAKRTFLELGIGHTIGSPPIKIYNQYVDTNVFTAVIGLNYRFGGKKI
jgi:hypothetical protein